MDSDNQAASRAPAPRRNSSSRRRSACMSVMRQLFLTSNWRWTWWTSISCDRTVEYSRRSRCSSSSCRIARWRNRAICRDVKYRSASGTHSMRAARSTEGTFPYYHVLSSPGSLFVSALPEFSPVIPSVLGGWAKGDSERCIVRLLENRRSRVDPPRRSASEADDVRARCSPLREPG